MALCARAYTLAGPAGEARPLLSGAGSRVRGRIVKIFAQTSKPPGCSALSPNSQLLAISRPFCRRQLAAGPGSRLAIWRGGGADRLHGVRGRSGRGYTSIQNPKLKVSPNLQCATGAVS